MSESPFPIPVADLRARYLALYSGALNDVLRFEHQLYHTCLPPEFAPLERGMKVCGLAFTVKGGPDLVTDGELELRAQMLEALHEDSVVVWDCTGDRVTAQWGEVMTMAATRRGCRGAVVNGLRDTAAILAQGFPVFHQYRTSAGMLGRFRLYHYQREILMGEALVRPGDWIYGDLDGVLCIPRELAYDVLLAAEKLLGKEDQIRGLVESGLSPTEVVEQGGYF